MAVPSNRVPVRVARGLKSALVSNLGDLLEGELLYAKDEDKLYMVEGGALVPMGADLAAASIDELSDVDTSTLAPTDGQVLTWDNAAGQWEPATPSAAPVDSVAGKTGAVTLELADNTDVDYGLALGTVYDYLEARSIDEGPSWTCPDDGAFSTAPSTWRTLSNFSSSGQSLEAVLNPTGGGTLWWATSPAGPYTQMTWTSRSFYTYCSGRRLYKLSNVTNGWPQDSSTTVDLYFLTSAPGPGTPADGQVLTWNNANSQWEPATPSVGASSIGDLSDVTITAAATGEVLRYNGSAWVDAALVKADISDFVEGDYATAAQGALADSAVQPTDSIDVLADVDTTTAAPTNGQVLEWNGTNWVPGTIAAGGVTQIVAGTNVTIDPAGGTGAVTINATGGGGGSASFTVVRTNDTKLAANSAATFTELGRSGQLVSITSDIDAWIVLYPTSALRTADAGRAYGTDPAPGAGVLAEAYVTAGNTVLVTPGTNYYNGDTTPADAIYAAVRDQAGAAANATVTILAYANIQSGSGTNRVTDSGTASGGTLDLTGLGQTGTMTKVTTDLDAWITFYSSAAARTADSARPFATDPADGSGVLIEFYLTAGSSAIVTPAATYFNNDATATEAIYVAVRDQSLVAVNATVTVEAYAETSYTGVSGGTFGSG